MPHNQKGECGSICVVVPYFALEFNLLQGIFLIPKAEGLPEKNRQCWMPLDNPLSTILFFPPKTPPPHPRQRLPG